MLLELQKDIIYGPVNSRRLGRSLGINILPAQTKACPFNCVYCQYGWTDYHQVKTLRPDKFPAVAEVGNALKETLLCMPFPLSYITFSGNGEPSVHPEIAQMVEAVTSIRDSMAPQVKTAILSNSALVSDPNIRESLEELDLTVMKLDAGSSETFEKYNQPCPGVDLENITCGLAEMKDVVIQALFTSGEAGNLETDNIDQWLKRLVRIRPRFVQLYTLDRGCPAPHLRPSSHRNLESIKKQVTEIGIPAEIF